ncbi:tRNA (N6-threonylcarbamoyladenosine(37)-N6)-methyltransferase TrmO [Candidatus Aerophobetes bacterium]|nr:tRNA (N6-threonylcarbamoyladenosine(37)-N6)-methyltransferase TrmO [Candidatus Aerophobetes bacterium]
MREPRSLIEEMINSGNLKGLLLKAGMLHGHFCPFLSLGVKAGFLGMKKLKTTTRGMEEVLAILETNNCFSDGIQIVTGCTFGNNGLIYRDFGKTAVTFTKRDKKGVRIVAKVNSRWLEEKYPETMELFEKIVKKREKDKEAEKLLWEKWKDISFALLNFSDDELFKIEEVEVKVPEYAPIFENGRCDNCGEEAIESRIKERNGKFLCVSCLDEGFYQLNGEGICFCRKRENRKGFHLFPVGYVESSFSEPEEPEKMREEESTIVIYPEYEDGLYRIEESDFLQVIFYFHKSSGYTLVGERRHGGVKGVFASRSPHRPSPLGLSTVRLLSREKNKLRVKGLDAINGTPVLDIKPYVRHIDDAEGGGEV